MNDMDIKKAFKDCIEQDGYCEECPSADFCEKNDGQSRMEAVLDLINRLEAENERLKGISDNKTKELLRYNASIEELHKKLETAKAEAYKEFAERLKKEIDIRPTHSNKQNEYVFFLIDNLLKEMVGEDND